MRQRHKTPDHFARNGSIQRSLHPWHRLSFKFGSSFVIEIETHARRIGIERICWNKTKSWAGLLVAYTSATLKPWPALLRTEPGVSIRLLIFTNFYSIFANGPHRSVCILIKTEKFSVSEMLRKEFYLWPFAKMLYHGWISTMTSSKEFHENCSSPASSG